MIRSLVCAVLGLGMAFAQPKPGFELADVHLSPRVMSPSMQGGFVRGDRPAAAGLSGARRTGVKADDD